MQPALDQPLYGLDPEATIGVEQAAAVEDSQRAVLLRPELIRPQHEPVFGGQSVHRHHLQLLFDQCRRYRRRRREAFDPELPADRPALCVVVWHLRCLLMQPSDEVKAFVVRIDGATVTEAELVAWCKQNMAAYKYPRIVEFRDSFPMTATGKILKRQLLKQAEPAGAAAR